MNSNNLMAIQECSRAPSTALPVFPSTQRAESSQGFNVSGQASRLFPNATRTGAGARNNPLDASFCGESTHSKQESARTPLAGTRINYRNSIDANSKTSTGKSPSSFAKTMNNFFGGDAPITAADKSGFRSVNNTRDQNHRARHSSIEPDAQSSIMGCPSVISEVPTKKTGKTQQSRAKSVGRHTNYSTFMSPKEMISFQMKRSTGGGDFGIDGYYLHNANYTKERTAKMWKGPKKTYIDDECKRKAFMPPPTKYAVHKHGSLIVTSNNVRANDLMAKDKRRTLPTDIADYEKKNQYPAPSKYKPNHSQQRGERLLGCFKFTEKLGGFLNEAMKRGKRSPDFDKKIDIKYTQVERKVFAPKYTKHEADKKKLPEFLNHVTKMATIAVSPTHYRGDLAKDYTRGKNDFKLLTGKRQSFSEYTSKQKQWCPPPGTYDLKKIDAGYNITTRGAARGYK